MFRLQEVGLSLLASCLNYWLEKPVNECPNMLIASHYHSLPNYLRNPNNYLSYHTMEVLKPVGTDDDFELDFQYRLVDGVIDNSYSTVTAQNNGIPMDVVERADEVGLSCIFAAVVFSYSDDVFRSTTTSGRVKPWSNCHLPSVSRR